VCVRVSVCVREGIAEVDEEEMRGAVSDSLPQHLAIFNFGKERASCASLLRQSQRQREDGTKLVAVERCVCVYGEG
jgi:hypothetical protein